MSAASVADLLSRGIIWRLESALPSSEPASAHSPGASSPQQQYQTRAGQFGIEAIDSKLPQGGLATGATHEWFFFLTKDHQEYLPGSTSAPSAKAASNKSKNSFWLPPLTLLAVLAGRAAHAGEQDPNPNELGCRTTVVWIGRKCWPTPTLLAATLGESTPWPWWQRCVFVDPPQSKRLWTINQALRCVEVAAVVADASGADLAATRRLQLAAEAGGTLGLLARPPEERSHLSAAASRWHVTPVPSPSKRPCWHIELAHCKGAQPTSQTHWNVEWWWNLHDAPSRLQEPTQTEQVPIDTRQTG